MKTYIEIEKKQEEYNNKYDVLDKNDEKTKEDRIIFGHWVDFLDDLLDWNILNYAEKIGFDFEKNNDIFEITDEVKKKIIITEEQAEKELNIREEICHRYPYGSCRNEWWINGINIDMLERDIEYSLRDMSKPIGISVNIFPMPKGTPQASQIRK